MVLVRKSLLLLLCLSVLGYGSAWAFDGHVIEADSNERPVLLKPADLLQPGMTENGYQDEERTAERSCCDHCCHISAHLHAIFPRNAYLIDAEPSAERLEYSEHFISCIVSPDLRPPRV